MAIKYRSDIDGLRAVAIVPVVLFHAGIAGFSGGFVGVDVFFVISGYLISAILIRDVESHRFSIAGFYERRIRRIAPAFLAMLLFVLCAAPLYLLPSELKTLPREAIGALFFYANIVFYLSSGYFSAAADAKPLLHTWSLGVEEQFYIFAPVVIFLVYRFCRRQAPAIFGAGVLISLALCIYLTPSKPAAAFYLLPTRAWELLGGALLATGIFNSLRNRLLSDLLAALGLLLILVAIFLFTDSMPFPGWRAILPVLGSMLILQFGDGTLVGRLLSLRPMVFIGLISFSLYLWHWPLIVFARDSLLLDTLAGRVAIVVVSVVIAIVSWRFIETPFRDRGRVGSRPLVIGSGVVAAALAVMAYGIHTTNGWPSRFSPQIVAYDNSRGDISPDRGRCHVSGGLRPADKLCRLGNGTPHVMLWSDSHGVEIAYALAEAGLPLIEATYSSCPPMLGLMRAERPQCATQNAMLLDYLGKTPTIDTVIVSARYMSPEIVAGVADVVAKLRALQKTVIVIGPMPNARVDAPSTLASGRQPDFIYSGIEEDAFRRAFAPGQEIVFPQDLFCKNETQCSLVHDGSVILFDDHHMSLSAARQLARWMMPQIQPALLAARASD
ncbi:acyltransferase [Mesorhizobium sp. BR1-1-16]|uniref:acyltransferase family protein n=1 Tax=Mesorhizobium sp. BR1-1-16 TaxID=2876653 RepID=UPI001CCA9687|nr:acyltransferase family protein [Mesorhizobium sp. BR1-1-16]MBZ9937895.1 acyltransferase [Mesorhizobium sp. BR1-1-16]